MKMERRKKSVVCNCAGPDPCKQHPPSPLRNLCSCILKSFCCCGCYCCCFQSAKTDLLDLRRKRKRVFWVAASLLYDLLPIKSQNWSPGRLWLSGGQMLPFFCQRRLSSYLTHLYIWAPERLIRKNQIAAGRGKKVNNSIIRPHFFSYLWVKVRW